MWQEVREEVKAHGAEVVTVALDTGGAQAAAPWIDAAGLRGPSLIDEAHLLDELFGIVNVPSGVWIDEHGTIVRPPEPAFPGRAVLAELGLPDDAPSLLREQLQEAHKINIDPERYLEAFRDWVAKGPESEFALGPEEVVNRSAPRSSEVSKAAANFELGQHLYRLGESEAAVSYFREAHRLQPDNWTYKRQAWVFAHPLQGPSDEYESDWLTEVRRIGAENYYPRVDL